ncbi:MAG TPA: sugar phosphate nucleotidyltransferase [Bdellovibrionota bacterium]|nr:sugar phosphate nucleotidyltransferase [Bdellovibrionota bacterium]
MDVLILAGGGGTRLWPLSRAERPKQLLRLPHQQTLIEQAVSRARMLVESEHVWIVTIASQVAATRQALSGFDPERILAEPMGRNSGPACCAATLEIETKRGQATTILVLTADQWIPEEKRFAETMRRGVKRAADGESLVTFGLSIREPRTDFGYVEITRDRAKKGAFRVQRFIEKPPLAKARKFARSLRHFWNSGMFAWRSDFFGKEMARYAPNIYRPLRQIDWSQRLGLQDLGPTYEKLPNLSIDYALMEKSRAVEVVPAKFDWSDLGTWAAVHEALAKTDRSNVVLGDAEVVDGGGNLVRSDSKPIVVCGVDDLVVVDTPDVTLVTSREKSRDLKKYQAKMRLFPKLR